MPGASPFWLESTPIAWTPLSTPPGRSRGWNCPPRRRTTSAPRSILADRQLVRRRRIVESGRRGADEVGRCNPMSGSTYRAPSSKPTMNFRISGMSIAPTKPMVPVSLAIAASMPVRKRTLLLAKTATDWTLSASATASIMVKRHVRMARRDLPNSGWGVVEADHDDRVGAAPDQPLHALLELGRVGRLVFEVADAGLGLEGLQRVEGTFVEAAVELFAGRHRRCRG